MILSIIKWMLMALLAATLGVVLAGQAGLLHGTPPSDLGVREGRLKAPSLTANSVSSQADLWPGDPQAAAALIAPLPLRARPSRRWRPCGSWCSTRPGPWS